MMNLPPNMSTAARLMRSSCVNAEPSSSLEAMIVLRESFRIPGFTFFFIFPDRQITNLRINDELEI